MLLDRFTLEQIRGDKDRSDRILKFHWDFYSALAYQRSKVKDRINSALLSAAEHGLEFDGWQRAVRMKYVLRPLSTEGSLVDPGGRFNVGGIDPSRFPEFPALYLAQDKATALQELLSQPISPEQEPTALTAALANPSSISLFAVKVRVDSVINLQNPGGLAEFVSIIRNFVVPAELTRREKQLKLRRLELIGTVSKLVEANLDPNWRGWPMWLDVPSPSQIFGQLVADAGVEGILYRSKFGGGRCLAIFMQNFANSASYVELTGELPEGLSPRRVDATTLDS